MYHILFDSNVKPLFKFGGGGRESYFFPKMENIILQVTALLFLLYLNLLLLF